MDSNRWEWSVRTERQSRVDKVISLSIYRYRSIESNRWGVVCTERQSRTTVYIDIDRSSPTGGE